MSPITVLLADDSAAVRRAVRMMLDGESAIEVVAEVSNIDETVALSKSLKPQIILVGFHMLKNIPKGLLPSLETENSRPLLMSVYNDADAHALAATIGASIVLDKMQLTDELIPAIIKLASEKTKRASG